MRRDLVLTGSMLLLALLSSGCSLFGIATKGEMRKAQERWENGDRSTRDQVSTLRKEAAEINQDLQEIQSEIGAQVQQVVTSIERLEGGEAETLRRLDGLAQRLSDARQQLANLEGGLRGDMESIQGEVVAMEGSVATMGSEVATASARVNEADARTRALGQSYATSLRLERELLLRKLQETEALLQSMDESNLLQPVPLARGNAEVPPPVGTDVP